MKAQREFQQFGQLLGAFQVADGTLAPEQEQYGQLLHDFQKLPHRERTQRKTFLEVAGVSRKEATHSNILAFLLRQDEEHGLGDLLLRSLLQASDRNDLLDSLPAKRVTVTRQDPTEDKKRIDIVVETDSFVLGVENKVLARLDSDFSEYRQHLEDLAKNSGNEALLSIGTNAIPTLLRMIRAKDRPALVIKCMDSRSNGFALEFLAVSPQLPRGGADKLA
jgi:hypothetical protein